MYKECASQTHLKVHPAILGNLKYHDSLEFDMDCLRNRQELPVFRFIAKAKSLNKLKAWSSLVKLDDLDYMMKADNTAYSEYIKSAVRQFYIKLQMEAYVEPNAPTSGRSERLLSLDVWENLKLMKSIQTNLTHNHHIQEIALVGYRMNEESCRRLNEGCLNSKSLKQIRLNLCIYKPKLLEILVPCLSKNLHFEEINLAANELGDDCGHMIAKII